MTLTPPSSDSLENLAKKVNGAPETERANAMRKFVESRVELNEGLLRELAKQVKKQHPEIELPDSYQA